MLGHVASAREASGRVVLRLGCGEAAADTALEAAVRIAEAFESEIEGLFVEDRQLLDITAYPFSKEIPLTGLGCRELAPDDIEREFRSAFHAAQRRLAALAKRTGARAYTTTVRDDPISALARACARAGPWNVVVLGEAFRPHDGRLLGHILEQVRDATGLVAVGPKTKRVSGRVVVAIEDTDRLTGMVRTAERLSKSGAGPHQVIVLLIGDDAEQVAWMEGQARLMLADGPRVDIQAAAPAHGEPASVAESIRQTAPGFLMAQHDGLTVPAGNMRALASVLECPLFLVR